jgi:hypothetical protein
MRACMHVLVLQHVMLIACLIIFLAPTLSAVMHVLMLQHVMLIACLIIFLAPTLSADITPGGQPNEGQRYSLTCAVSGDEMLAVSARSVRWERVGVRIEVSREFTITFNLLRTSDAGEYRCTYIISSPYILRTLVITETYAVAINRMYIRRGR